MDLASKLGSTVKHADALLSVSSIMQGSDSRRMSSSLRQSITARRVSHGGAVTTLFTEEVAADRGIPAPQSTVKSVLSDNSRRSSTAVALAIPNPGRSRRTSRCLHEIQVQPRVMQRTLSQHQLLLLTPFGGTTPLMTPTTSSTPLRRSGDLSSGIFAVPATKSYSSQQHDRNGGPGQLSLLPGSVSQSPLSPKTEGMLLSVDMARASSMPTFTARENQASKEKDEALGINRGGETFVWLDDESVSDHGEISLVTPLEEPKHTDAHTLADVQSRFSEFTWDRAGPSLFADPFDKSGQPTSSIANPCPLTTETSPGRSTRRVETSWPGSVASDPPSPTQRPAMLRYRSSPDLQAQDPAGLNIVLASSSSQMPISPWYSSTVGSTSTDDGKSSSSSPKVSISESGSVVLMSRSAGQTGASTLANLLPRLSYAPLGLQGMDIPNSFKRSYSGSQRGSWAQLNVVDFSPPAVTLGRDYRARFNSIDSAIQRNSDAASMFGSVHSSDWMKPTLPENDEWTRRSTDWSASSSRRGSDSNARRRSSLVRTAHTNMHLSRPGSVSFAAPPKTNSNFFGQESHDSTVPGPSRGFRFGSAVSGLSNLVPSDTVLREVDEVAEDTDWYMRRGSWAEV